MRLHRTARGKSIAMLLTAQQSYALLAQHGCYITEICDRCGRGLGPARFARRGESGVWCSRECRDGASAHAPGTCRHCRGKLSEGKRRGTVFCDDACKQAAHRAKPYARKPRTPKLSVTKPPIYAAFSPENERLAIPLAGRPFQAGKSALRENGGVRV